MTSPRFLRPKSLYVEMVGIGSDGKEVVIRAKYEALDRDSQLTWNDDTVVPDDITPPQHLAEPALHNVTIHFTRANAADPVPHGD